MGLGVRRFLALLIAGASTFVVPALADPTAASTGPPRMSSSTATRGGYVLDAYGGTHPFGGAPPVTAAGYWPGHDLARGMALAPNGGGWTLDAWGGVHSFGGAPTAIGPSWFGRDLARAVVSGPSGGGWVLDASGGIHAFGGAATIAQPAYWPGQDLARAMILRPAGGGWIVDAYGGVHPFGGAPTVISALYLPGTDAIRAALANRAGPGGWVVDRSGGIHSFGGAPPLFGTGYWPGQDLTRGLVPDPQSNGGWVVDAAGGLHPVGPAPTMVGTAYFPGQDLARGGGSSAGGASGHAAVATRRTPVIRRVTYSIAVLGTVRSNVWEFIAAVESTYADERGWAAAGFEFVRVPSGGEMTVWLAQAQLVPNFGAPCDSFYSCHQGRNDIINDDRFAGGSPTWPGPLEDYRHMVINHETGHWIGFGHSRCGGLGQLAPVMMQQSISLRGCVGNPWPLPDEIAAARSRALSISALGAAALMWGSGGE